MPPTVAKSSVTGNCWAIADEYDFSNLCHLPQDIYHILKSCVNNKKREISWRRVSHNRYTSGPREGNRSFDTKLMLSTRFKKEKDFVNMMRPSYILLVD